MELGRRTFPFSSFNHARQKQQVMQQQQQNVSRHPRWMQALSPPINGGSAESQIANLQQCISAYLDSIQMVCRAGSWLSETLAFLLRESSSGTLAEDMKAKFTEMLQLSISTTVQAKNDLARILMELSLPNLNNNNQAQAIKDCKVHNAKILEKCIHCLSIVHNSFFKSQLDMKTNNPQDEAATPTADNNENTKDTKTPQDPNNNASTPTIEKPSIDFNSEWNGLIDSNANAKSWFALKERTGSLRKYNGLTDTEIQNLLKSDSVSDLYMKKLNQKIDTALRNYEVGLRGLPPESMVVFGGFHSSPDQAKLALKSCCSQMEMEQDIQRLHVSQFLHCELPLMALTVNKKDFSSANSSNSSANISNKKNAVSQLIQLTNQKLSISETDELSSEILGEICPARWRTHVKACLQLLFGNCGLVIMDTVSRESRNKQNAMVCQRDSFIVVSVLSTWCVKEDPGTMSLLQRALDPEKSLATIHVRYVSVFNLKPDSQKRFEPGIFVETFVQTGSQNRRRASQTLRGSQSISGMPATAMSACWLSQQAAPQGSAISMCRATAPEDAEASVKNVGSSVLVKKSSSIKSEGGDSGSGSERRRKKKIVVEIKTDTASEEEKSSDSEDSVKDVIHLLSGNSRRATRKRFQIEREAREAETDEMSEVIEKILDCDMVQSEKDQEPEEGTAGVSDEPNTTSSAQQSEPKQEISQVPEDQQKAAGNETQPESKPSPPSSSLAHTVALSQSQSNLTHSQARIDTPLFHQKSKSQTLPLSYASIQQNMPIHQHSKSMSNTLPHLRGRNTPHNPFQAAPNHPYQALPSKQPLNIPMQQQLRCGPGPMLHGADPRHFIQRNFNPQQIQKYPSNSSTPTQPMPHPTMNSNPAGPPRQMFAQLQTQSMQGQPRPPQRFPPSDVRYIGAPNGMLPNTQAESDPRAPNQPNMPPPMPQYVPSNQDDQTRMSSPPGNVQVLLQHFNKLAMETKQQTIRNDNQRFNENVTIQQLLMLGQNQQGNNGMHLIQQNSNNNNLPSPLVRHGAQEVQNRVPPSNSPRWNMGKNSPGMDPNNNSGGILGQGAHPQRITPNMNNPNNNRDASALGYNTSLMQAAFQQQIRLQQEMQSKDDLRSKSPNQMDQFVSPTQHGSLGPIGSPVITRRRTNEMTPPQHLAAQHQGSNTWPFIRDLPMQAENLSEGDPEYQQYVEGIAKIAIQRKLMSQRSIDELEAKSNTWNMQSRSNTWNPSHDSGELPAGNSFSVFDTPDLAQHIRGCDNNFSGDGDKPVDMMDSNPDSARTGTWPPWQIWSTGNNAIWNWSSDLLNTSESPNLSQNAEN